MLHLISSHDSLTIENMAMLIGKNEVSQNRRRDTLTRGYSYFAQAEFSTGMATKWLHGAFPCLFASLFDIQYCTPFSVKS